MSNNNSAQHLWVYEVTVHIHRTIFDEYTQVVRSHMTMISALPGFHPIPTAHQVESDPTAEEERIAWVIRYFADSREAIQGYFDTLAPTLRQETVVYGDKVVASRRILHPPAFVVAAGSGEETA